MSTHEEDDSDSVASSDAEEEENTVESLVAGRERRATAGRWLGSLIAKAAVDDAEQEVVDRTLDEIFDEGIPEEDIDFQEDAGNDDKDMAMSESDSEEDAGAEQGDEDLEGERQLRKAERAERLVRKRKARNALVAPMIPAKKIKTVPAAPTTESQATPKSRVPKKSERQSWLPIEGDAPVRASTRTQTMQNKATVHARMRESEKRRQRTVASMEAAARRKLKEEQPPKTQEERLAEAALVERKNSRSLNKWQLAEEQRQAEQKAKLEALRSKKLEGPIISWYSGPGHWVNGLLKGTGKSFRVAEISDASINDLRGSVKSLKIENNATSKDVLDRDSRPLVNPPQTLPDGSQNHTEGSPATQLYPSEQITDRPQGPLQSQSSSHFLHGIYDYASLPYQDQTPRTSSIQSGPPSVPTPIQHSPSPNPAPVVELALRSLIIMADFAELERLAKSADRQEATPSVLLGSKKTKIPKATQIMCPVTNQPARYLDPKTNLPYSTLYAYRYIQKIVEGKCQWSSLLGCFVGPTYDLPHGKPAAGVPERFAAPAGVEGNTAQSV